MADLRIGISGWVYPKWRSRFYPKGLPQKRELEYAARALNSIEINGTFYSLQKPESFARWAEQTPDDFVFSIKGNRYITHMRRLKDIEQPLANFFASGILKLGAKLGPILWQFPQRMPFLPDRFERFLDLLPHNTEQAAALARRHDERMNGRAWTETDVRRPLRHAFEVRSETFVTEDFIKLLRAHNAAWVIADAAGLYPYAEEVTADFVYARLHGATELYASGYDEDDLEDWARRIRAWRKGGEVRDAERFSSLKPRKRAARNVFVYFDNDAKVYAPFNAMRLAEMLGVKSSAPDAQAALRRAS